MQVLLFSVALPAAHCLLGGGYIERIGTAPAAADNNDDDGATGVGDVDNVDKNNNIVDENKDRTSTKK